MLASSASLLRGCDGVRVGKVVKGVSGRVECDKLGGLVSPVVPGFINRRAWGDLAVVSVVPGPKVGCAVVAFTLGGALMAPTVA